MSRGESNPPKAAIWFLRCARPGSHNQALTGDLLEKFREGRSRGWFWRQVLIAIAVGVLGEVRRHWPQFCYAFAGAVMPAFLWKSVEHAPGFLHRWAPWWPWSRFILEWSRDALLALAALPILAVALVINGAFRWVSLLRTGVIYLALIALEHYPLVYLLDLVPWLGRPVAGNPQVMVLIPTAFQMLLSFSTFLFSAWLGCRSPRHADELAERAKS